MLLVVLLLAALLTLPASARADGLQFDGVNDYVEAGPDPTATQSGTARTWEAWVRTEGTGYHTIVSRYQHASGREPWIMWIYDGKPGITLNGAAYRDADVAVNDGEWHHVAAVWVPGNRLDVYVDGKKRNGALHGAVPTSLTQASDITVRMGVSWHGGTFANFHDGDLDDVRYSTTARYGEDEFTPARCWDVDEYTVGQWTFEEGAGTTTATLGQMTTDAELVNGTSWFDGDPCPSMLPNDALRFDGDDDYLEVGADPTAADTGTARTWEAWVKTTSNEYQAVLSRHASNGDAAWVFDMEDGVPRIHLRDGGSRGARYADAAVSDGEWHHLAAVWEPGERLDIYIDGEQANGALGGGGVPSTIAQVGSAPVLVGVGNDDGDLEGHFDGDIDGVRYSGVARYDENFDPALCWEVDEHTIAQLAFDDGSGTTTPIVGELAADAELINGVTWVSGNLCVTDPDPEPEPSSGALNFDGANDFVEAGLDPTATQSTTPRTWEAWVKTSSAAYQAPMSRFQPGGLGSPWLMWVEGGYPGLSIGTNRYRRANRAVHDGQWHHIAVVWVPSQRFDIYVDGVIANGTLFGSIPASIEAAQGLGVRLGTSWSNGAISQLLNGSLDGVRYSSIARYAPNQTFVPEKHPTADANTIGLWNFDEGIGTTTATGGQMTAAAVLTNGVTWTTGP